MVCLIGRFLISLRISWKNVSPMVRLMSESIIFHLVFCSGFFCYNMELRSEVGTGMVRAETHVVPVGEGDMKI